MTNISQKKYLSQVFLNTTVPCEQLASLLTKEGVDSVLEIGPGKGILTGVLLKQGFSVTSVEKDERFVDYLNKHFQKEIAEKKLTVIHHDILTFDLEAWRARKGQNLSICGNIPYNISTPLVELLLPQLEFLRISALLVQLEFAQRLCSPPGTRNYGSLSVFTQLRSDPKFEFEVDRSLFTPIPKVDSAIISLKYKKQEAEIELLKTVEKLTKAAFSQRRKKLSNALSRVLTEEQKLKLHAIDFSLRPESITPKEYLEIAKIIRSKE